MNKLAEHNTLRQRDIQEIRDAVRERRARSVAPRVSDYPFAKVQNRIVEVLSKEFDDSRIEWVFDTIDRTKFNADIAVRSTTLLRELGAKEYIATAVPRIAAALRSNGLVDTVEEVSTKGIYVNMRLTDQWFLGSVQEIIDLGERFGLSDAQSDRRYVVDYSSPNVAKTLHAGHLRSTMIGHVLGNLFEACGSLVYRVNHINDFGGFGFMLEGYRRFLSKFPVELTENQRLLEVYKLRRALERAGNGGAVDGDERELLARYFPEVEDGDGWQTALAEFTAAADRRFEQLENGEAEEVELWQDMVQWSLADFESFYTALDIDIDFVIGESFYLEAGDKAIDEAVSRGTAYRLSAERVAAEIAALDTALEGEEITPQARDKSVLALGKDIDAIVVPLSGGERMVVRRSDGRSIYATRDIGAIKMRRELFEPTDIDYVVGQEQQVHFARLFEAAEVIGLAEQGKPRFQHIYFGFYVDENGRKLSSRESVAGVNDLLAAAVTHFREKSAEGGGMTEEELYLAGRQLAVGSILFNDLRRDMKGAVAIPRGDLAPVLADFEKSGGPYVVYSACRARAILRKYGKPVPSVGDVGSFEISDQEAALILALLELPGKVVKAAEDVKPAVLVRHLLDIAGIYNSYYASSPVLSREGPNLARLMITRAVQRALTNGLALCHIECPPKI